VALEGCTYRARARLGVSGKYSWSGSTDWKAWGPEAQFSTDAPAPTSSKQQQRQRSKPPPPEPEPSTEEEEEEAVSNKEAATTAVARDVQEDASGSMGGLIEPDGYGSEAGKEGNTDDDMDHVSNHVRKAQVLGNPHADMHVPACSR
jgi:hypothetical protein